MIKSNQGLYNKEVDWKNHVEIDKNLLACKNPASPKAVALEIINKLLNNGHKAYLQLSFNLQEK